MKKIFSTIALTAAALFFAAGCSSFFTKDSDSENSTCAVTVSSAADGISASTSARSAYPSALGSLYVMYTAKDQSSTDAADDVTAAAMCSASVTMNLIPGRVWVITAKAYILSELSMTGTQTLDLTSNSGTAVTVSVPLYQASDSTGNGYVSLKITDSRTSSTNAVVNVITAVCSSLSSSPVTLTAADSDSDGDYDTWTWTNTTGITAGVYDVTFKFYAKDGGSVVGGYRTRVAVFAGCTTDKWYESSSDTVITASDSLAVTDDMFLANLASSDSKNVCYYVANGSGILAAGYDNTTADSSGNYGDGTYEHPFATPSFAAAYASYKNTGSESFVILLDGTFSTFTNQTAIDSNTIDCTGLMTIPLVTGTSFTLTIKALSGTATLDGSSVCVPVYCVNSDYTSTLTLTLKNLILKNGVQTSTYYGAGADFLLASGSASAVTFTNCQITGNSGPAVYAEAQGTSFTFTACTVSGNKNATSSSTSTDTSGTETTTIDCYAGGMLTAATITLDGATTWTDAVTFTEYNSSTTASYTVHAGTDFSATADSISVQVLSYTTAGTQVIEGTSLTTAQAQAFVPFGDDWVSTDCAHIADGTVSGETAGCLYWDDTTAPTASVVNSTSTKNHQINAWSDSSGNNYLFYGYSSSAIYLKLNVTEAGSGLLLTKDSKNVSYVQYKLATDTTYTTLSLTSAGSGIYTCDFGSYSSFTSNTAYDVQLIMQDNAGNVSSVVSYTLYWKTDCPELDLTAPTFTNTVYYYSSTTPVTFSGTAYDLYAKTLKVPPMTLTVCEDSGTEQTVTVADDGTWTYTGFTNASTGKHTITFTNTSYRLTSEGSYTYVIYIASADDTTAPTVSLSGTISVGGTDTEKTITLDGSETTVYVGSGATLTATDTESGIYVSKCTVTSASSTMTGTASGNSYTYSVSDGTLVYTVADYAGNSTSSSTSGLTVVVDGTAPTISAFTNSGTTMTITASDSGSGIASVTVTDGTTTTTLTGTNSVYTPTSVVSGTTYTFTVTDNAGNTATTSMTGSDAGNTATTSMTGSDA